MLAVSDLETRPVISVAIHAPLTHCAALMWQHEIRHLAVLDDHGALVGLVTDFAAQRAMRDDRWEAVAGTLSEPWKLVVPPSASALEVLFQLGKRGCDAAVVVDDDGRNDGARKDEAQEADQPPAPSALPPARTPRRHARRGVTSTSPH